MEHYFPHVSSGIAVKKHSVHLVSCLCRGKEMVCKWKEVALMIIGMMRRDITVSILVYDQLFLFWVFIFLDSSLVVGFPFL